MAHPVNHRHGGHHRGAVGRVVSGVHGSIYRAESIWRQQVMREPRRQGYSGDDGVIGNADKLEVQSSDSGRSLIPTAWGAIIASIITASASLLIYSFNQIRHIDERLDLLEQEGRIVLKADGSVRPSEVALQSKYQIEALLDRVRRLELRQIKP